MTGWSRSRSHSKLLAWARAQDLMTVETELEKTRREAIGRRTSLSLDPHHAARRQAERAHAQSAQERLINLGLLPPQIKINGTTRTSDSSARSSSQPPRPTPTSSEGTELSRVQEELARVKLELSKLKDQISSYTNKVKAERMLMINRITELEAERMLMINTITELEAEVEEGWNRVIRHRKTFDPLGIPLPNGVGPRRYQHVEEYRSLHELPRGSPTRVSFSDQFNNPSRLGNQNVPNHRSLHPFPTSSLKRSSVPLNHLRTGSVDLDHQRNFSSTTLPPVTERHRRTSFS